MRVSRPLFLVLWAACLPSVPAWARGASSCDVPAMARVLEKRLGVVFPRGGQSSDVIDLVCKTQPEHGGPVTIVALFHDLKTPAGDPVDDQKGLAVAVVDVRRGIVKSLYQDNLELNPGIRITDTSLSIDPGRYELGPDIRAWGVRMNIGHAPKCADGGTSNYLTLLVPDGKRLRAVLKRQPLHVWTVAKWNLADNIDSCSIDTINEADLTLSPGSATSHGWRDLNVTARIQSHPVGDKDGQRPFRKKTLVTLHYDGSHYPGNLGPMATKLLRP
ncbi:MAG: hypothetical protein EOP36_00745 [Rubrivivax sp.]|nr:MAG: hypothetical protein EOP36_00745 [Rubrivivax sp.]